MDAYYCNGACQVSLSNPSDALHCARARAGSPGEQQAPSQWGHLLPSHHLTPTPRLQTHAHVQAARADCLCGSGDGGCGGLCGGTCQEAASPHPRISRHHGPRPPCKGAPAALARLGRLGQARTARPHLWGCTRHALAWSSRVHAHCLVCAGPSLLTRSLRMYPACTACRARLWMWTQGTAWRWPARGRPQRCSGPWASCGQARARGGCARRPGACSCQLPGCLSCCLSCRRAGTAPIRQSRADVAGACACTQPLPPCTAHCLQGVAGGAAGAARAQRLPGAAGRRAALHG